jgi:hypothetical protein
LRSFSYDDLGKGNKSTCQSTGTCSWIFRHSQFKEWLGSGQELLWIRGKPGSGKSTLLKYVANHLKTCETAAQDSEAVVAFYYVPHFGDNVHKSAKGILQSLLNQLLSRRPEYISSVTPLFKQRCETIGRPAKDWEWQPDELRGLLEKTLASISQNLESPVFLIIDALDECSPLESEQLLEFCSQLLSVSTRRTVRICLSSRPDRYREFHDHIEHQSIAVDDENREDLRRFTLQKIESFSTALVKNIDTNLLIEDLLNRASGVFLWVALVMNNLFRDNDKVWAPYERPGQIPTDFDSLYQYAFERISKPNPETARKLFGWVAFARRPLSIQELTHALEVEAGIAQVGQSPVVKELLKT